MDMIILMGLQASGKSTFYRTLFAATHEHISKDLLHSSKHKNKKQAENIERAFQAHHPVVIDNTNSTIEDRRVLIELGHMYGAKITGYYFESDVAGALERNQQRQGKAQVPDIAIYITANKFVRPTYSEGFDELYYVRIGNNSTLEDPRWIIEEVSDGEQRKGRV